MTGERWSDERLAAAYRSRYGGVAPAGLAEETASAVRVGRPTASAADRPGWLGWLGVAAAITVIVAGSIAFLARGEAPGATDDPETGWPESVFGLPVIGVEEAIARRDADPEERAVAVAGYYGPIGGLPVECPAPASKPSPIELRCPDQFSWLMRDPEQLVTHEGNTWSGRPPTGPALNPIVRPPVGWDLGRDPSLDPRPPLVVVAIGHFDDHRAAFCPAAQRDACRRAFVVDRLAWVDGSVVSPDPRIEVDTPTVTDAAVVASLAASAGDGGQVLSVGATSSQDLSSIEPAATVDPRLASAEVVWIVKRLDATGDRPTVATILMPDGTFDAYLLGRSGITAFAPPSVPSATPAPSGTATVAPPDPGTPFDVPLVDPLGRSIVLTIVDESGLLVSARSIAPDEPFPGEPSLVGPPIVTNPGGRLTELTIEWPGSICNGSWRLRIDPSAKMFDLSGREVSLCDESGLAQKILLVFSVPVSAGEVVATVLPREALPEPDFSVELADAADIVTRLEVYDETGLVVAVRSARPDELDPLLDLADSMAGSVSNPTGRPNEVVIQWYGGPCDVAHVFAIQNRGRSISMSDRARGGPCQHPAIPRGLVITFAEAVPASEVTIARLEKVIVD